MMTAQIKQDRNFLEAILNSLSQQIAVVDATGRIKWVNRAWVAFFEANGGNADADWRDVSYINVCKRSASQGDTFGNDALTGITSVTHGLQGYFELEYPCFSEDRKRWFLMRVKPLEQSGTHLFIVSHEDITSRKQAEEQTKKLAVQDGLTGLANRRHFDEVLTSELRRARRFGQPVSLIMGDIDFFKDFNDQYGHMEGDDCLKRISACLQKFGNRPSDLVARYGGEEFAIILGATEADQANRIAGDIRQAVEALGIANEHGLKGKPVTMSLGVATIVPDSDHDADMETLISAADEALYTAKEQGRNRVVTATGA